MFRQHACQTFKSTLTFYRQYATNDVYTLKIILTFQLYVSYYEQHFKKYLRLVMLA